VIDFQSGAELPLEVIACPAKPSDPFIFRAPELVFMENFHPADEFPKNPTCVLSSIPINAASEFALLLSQIPAVNVVVALCRRIRSFTSRMYAGLRFPIPTYPFPAMNILEW